MVAGKDNVADTQRGWGLARRERSAELAAAYGGEVTGLGDMFLQPLAGQKLGNGRQRWWLWLPGALALQGPLLGCAKRVAALKALDVPPVHVRGLIEVAEAARTALYPDSCSHRDLQISFWACARFSETQ